MWVFIARTILRFRIPILIMLALITALMVFMSGQVKNSYKFGGLLPATDSTYIAHQDFIEKFSEDGNILVLGVQGEKLYELETFKAWTELGRAIRKEHGVDSVFSVANLYDLQKNDSIKRFDLRPVMEQVPETQKELDSLRRKIHSLKFYDGLLYNDSTKASLMMVFVNAPMFNSERRGDVVERIVAHAEVFADEHMKVYYSGLPFIRTVSMKMVRSEMLLFVALAALVTSLLLLLFFKSFRVMWFSMVVVITGVIWSMGILALLDYKLTILMAVIPPLLIVIGIPNCIFLLNKYHHEYVEHGNKIKALSRVIQKIGNATFLTNTTTALGFATFMLTYSDNLKQFGLVAALNIMMVFLLSILLIPILFSFQPPPKKRHTKHLERTWLEFTVNKLVKVVVNYRKLVYLVTVLLLVFGGIGMYQLKVNGHVVDDLPEDNQIMTDLNFVEDNFNGIMPLEILVDTKKRGHALKSKTLKKIDQLQDTLSTYSEFSRSLSVVDAVKFSRQAFYNGNPKKYDLIKNNEKSFISPYLKGVKDEEGMTSAFIDTAKQVTRITVQMEDIGTIRMDGLLQGLRTQVDSIFDPADYDVTMTGTSVVFLKGSEYMVKNLIISLVIAVFVIAGIMALLFNSFRMVLVSLLPNLIPLITTAAIMGYFGISIKPSTILVFSIAFGISVDDTIHYLAKFRQELKLTDHNVHISVLEALRETGISMIYTSIVLFFGFSIFIASEFGGTQALGILVSITLLVAMSTNLLLLPSLLLSFNRSIATKAFEEPLLDIYDEEEDIELSDLEIQKEPTEL